MSTQPDFAFKHRSIANYQRDPSGFTVDLKDGRRVEVSSYRDTPAGRMLRIKGSRKHVPAGEVAAVVVFSLILKEHKCALCGQPMWKHRFRPNSSIRICSDHPAHRRGKQ